MRCDSRVHVFHWLFAAALSTAWAIALTPGAAGAGADPEAAEGERTVIATDALANRASVRSRLGATDPGADTGAAPVPLGDDAEPWTVGPAVGHQAVVHRDEPRASFLDRISYRPTGPPFRIG